MKEPSPALRAPRNAASGKPRKPYASPTVTRLGNMADVTLKSGAGVDNSPRWPSKQ